MDKPVLCVVVRCPRCRGLGWAAVIKGRDIYPPEMERLSVEMVRAEPWCLCHE